ncbi:MAG: glycosyltransferase, partial [Candidatus Eisenbacteria bacterium]
ARQAARELLNLEVHGYLEQAQVATLLGGASLFVHTSPAEGFPNTLLEAWSHGIPSLSCVDPDGVVARHRIGEVVGDVPGLTEAAVAWMADPGRRREAGERARAYVRAEHGPDKVLDRLLAVLSAAATERSPRA